MKEARMLLGLMIACCCGLIACSSSPGGGGEESSLDVMTFNIRVGLARDGGDSWKFRKELVFEVIRRESPDAIGLQEALRSQLDEILQQFPEYGFVGMGRDPGGRGEYSAILYRKGRLDPQASDTFWLSDTPEVPSADWGNHYLRICTWARFLDQETGAFFYMYNTHFDHESQPAREKSALLLAQRIGERTAPDPVIVTGDFNAGEDNPAITYLTGKDSPLGASSLTLKDSFRSIHPDEKVVGTFNFFRGSRGGPKIDYVFVSSEFQVTSAEIIRYQRDQRYPSDHYPVTARVELFEQP